MDITNIFNTEFFEMCFLLCFAAAWPVNIYKSLKSRTAKGKSVAFELIVILGYLFGIVAKLVDDHLSYVIVFYVINTLMVSIDVVLYFRNVRLDKQRDAAEAAACKVA